MILEHIDNVVDVMEELYRILKNDEIVRIYAPYSKSEWDVQDPTHKHFFNEKSMDYFIDDYRYNYYTNIRFKKIHAYLYTSDETLLSKLRNLIPFRNVLTYFLFNMYDGIYFELKAIKDL
ncbi:MAG: hypothetical protein ACR2LN_04755 [Candidatus Levyibacteriota bacterium]